MRPFGCDQLSVPAQDGVGCDDGGNLAEQSTTEDLALRSESTSLVVGQAQAFAAELLLQHAVLLDEVVDGLGLVAVDPAGERGEEELEGEELGREAAIG